MKPGRKEVWGLFRQPLAPLHSTSVLQEFQSLTNPPLGLEKHIAGA